MTLNLLGFKPNDNEADGEHEGDKGIDMLKACFILDMEYHF